VRPEQREPQDDTLKLSHGRLWSSATVMDWMTPCQLGERVVSDVQDFVADSCARWWPVVGRHHMAHRIDCTEDRPELVLTL
jgi:hypothetical protein